MKHRKLAESLYAALIEDPFYVQLEEKITRSGIAGKQGMLRYYDYSIEMAQTHGLLTLPKTKACWGAALWSLPFVTDLDISPNKPDHFTHHMGLTAYQHYQTVSNSMAQLTRPYISEQDWYLSIIGITPTHQSQGLGKQLMDPVLNKANQAGARIYLETFEPRNISFYERFGFLTQAILHEPVMKADYHLLIRPAADCH